MRRSLGNTLVRLKALAKGHTELGGLGHGLQTSTRLKELNDFGSNPGGLKGWQFVPASAAGSPLVVVLHGCTQGAAGYDSGSGWSELADRYGFALLYPEQQRTNNPNLCFNWFRDEDTSRGAGEALSIRQMIAAMVERNALDDERVFITGLSAGGAMSSVMLATYPEIFAGGAIIAGLPFGAASSVPEALERMRGQGHVADAAYASMVRRASQHGGRWPTISVWHGTADATVAPVNADAIVGQWRLIHGVGEAPDSVDMVDGFPRRSWQDESGKSVIQEYRITGMGHGTPLQVHGDEGLGVAVPHMLNVGISSTRHIADGWGLLEHPRRLRTVPAESSPRRIDQQLWRNPKIAPPVTGVQATIEAALRSAGLMR